MTIFVFPSLIFYLIYLKILNLDKNGLTATECFGNPSKQLRVLFLWPGGGGGTRHVHSAHTCARAHTHRQTFIYIKGGMGQYLVAPAAPAENSALVPSTCITICYSSSKGCNVFFWPQWVQGIYTMHTHPHVSNLSVGPHPQFLYSFQVLGLLKLSH